GFSLRRPGLRKSNRALEKLPVIVDQRHQRYGDAQAFCGQTSEAIECRFRRAVQELAFGQGREPLLVEQSTQVSRGTARLSARFGAQTRNGGTEVARARHGSWA